ncbi:hypothetical protein ACELLULO517_22355 [Acidisoma cellulosilytica]|uniref:Uncharacterized protein n=1 Tax=Acidisoma cellulosilyticum TaxID=2802395 RepID=A0A964E608_9PROT|nr:hypothetical protein [Acidisoma cellulosilyticum]MCB8883007.1 hypothetical protein [Acidisoma cellulosilyticum]
MSVSATSASSTGAANSSVSQPQNTDSDAAATFADWLKDLQDAGQASSSSSAATGTGFPVNLSDPSAAFAAHLSNGITIGVVALSPVSSGQVQQMAKSVEEQVQDWETGMTGGSASSAGTPSSSENESPTASSGESGAVGMYDSLPDGVELMGYSAGTANGGPNVQDMANGMDFMLTSLEKTSDPSVAS